MNARNFDNQRQHPVSQKSLRWTKYDQKPGLFVLKIAQNCQGLSLRPRREMVWDSFQRSIVKIDFGAYSLASKIMYRIHFVASWKFWGASPRHLLSSILLVLIRDYGADFRPLTEWLRWSISSVPIHHPRVLFNHFMAFRSLSPEYEPLFRYRWQVESVCI